MKKIITIILLFSIIFTFVSCGENTKEIKETEYISKSTQTAQTTMANPTIDNLTATNIPTVTSTITPTPTPEKKLSSDCDKVLASGYDKDNNFYELVANEHEDYSGTTIEMGVIKNNKWLISLTTETPFSVDFHTLVGRVKDKEYLYSLFEYIGAGCFYFLYSYDIWNVNNGKVYDHDYNDSFRPIVKCVTTCVNNDGKVILAKYDASFKILDTKTMTVSDTKIIGRITDNGNSYPYSEGLFAVLDKYEGNPLDGFYDCNGNKIIDLSMYDIQGTYYISDSTYGPDLFFKNGKCTFRIENDQGSYYNITIDKTGKVVNSEKIE